MHDIFKVVTDGVLLRRKKEGRNELSEPKCVSLPCAVIWSKGTRCAGAMVFIAVTYCVAVVRACVVLQWLLINAGVAPLVPAVNVELGCRYP